MWSVLGSVSLDSGICHFRLGLKEPDWGGLALRVMQVCCPTLPGGPPPCDSPAAPA